MSAETDHAMNHPRVGFIPNARARNSNTHKFLSDDPEVIAVSDAPLDYEVDEGVLVDRYERAGQPSDRTRHASEYRVYWEQFADSDRRKAEEAEWAARSGPVYIKRAPTAGIAV